MKKPKADDVIVDELDLQVLDQMERTANALFSRFIRQIVKLCKDYKISFWGLKKQLENYQEKKRERLQSRP